MQILICYKIIMTWCSELWLSNYVSAYHCMEYHLLDSRMYNQSVIQNRNKFEHNVNVEHNSTQLTI